jgi:tRNA pseudouridine13 synthase
LTPAEAELEVGIECYATTGAPCTGKVKSAPEDFAVEEAIAPYGLIPDDLPSYYPLYRVEKRSIDTLHMAGELSAALRSRVSYAGLKDRRAVAVQYVTPTSKRAARPSRVVRANFIAEIQGFVPKPLSRGALVGNRFTLKIRGCCSEIEARIREAVELALSRRMPNFYGLQRFGTGTSGTHLIGKELIAGNFEGAVTRLLGSSYPSHTEGGKMLEEAAGSGRFEEVVSLLPPGKDVERMVAMEAARHPADWVGAVRAAPVALRRLYVHAYQSWIFNRTLSRAVSMGEDISVLKKGDNWASVSRDGLVTSRVGGVKDPPAADSVPMVQVVGYAYRDYGSRFDSLTKDVLEEEGVTPAQFFVEGMQEVSSEGGFRRPHLGFCGASWKVAEGTSELKFTLGKGQYATALLREIIKPRDPAAAGLA